MVEFMITVILGSILDHRPCSDAVATTRPLALAAERVRGPGGLGAGISGNKGSAGCTFAIPMGIALGSFCTWACRYQSFMVLGV